MLLQEVDFQALSAEKSQALLEELDAWLSEHEITGDVAGRYVSLGIYFYTSDAGDEENKP